MIQIHKPSKSSRAVSVGLLILRMVCGLAFMFHGYGKIQNPFSWMGAESSFPGFLQALAALSEFGGGLAWILGALTPLASFGIFCTMLVATHLHAVVMKDPFVPSGPGQGSYELAAIFGVVSLLFILAGPGRYSVDRLIFGERE